jgi:disulfide oxidoreductase YuzD
MDLSNTPLAAQATEHFDFGSSAADLQASGAKRNIRSEVNNKGFDPEAVIDAYETAKGIKKRAKADPALDYAFKNIILDPEQQKDQDMLNELMNNKKYMITLWKDTWTAQGSFRVFIIYGIKKEKEDTK